MSSRKLSNFSLILILGSLTALSPFAIDMYLPAFPKMAEYFQTSVSRVSLSLSGYFIGLALGQLFYGPLLDRFGRKRPLYVGLSVFILATAACLFAESVEALIGWRVVQALGGCVANVGAIAMVRDFFAPKESSKVFSSLILILGASPLLAPTTGGYLASHWGWHAVFVALGVIALLLLLVVIFILPEGHAPDPSHSLRLGPIFRTYGEIFKNVQFQTYTFSGAVIFSGMFVYLASSPSIFMQGFQVTEQVYGWIFGFIAAGFIMASQLNIFLLRFFKSEQVLKFGMLGFSFMSCVLFFIAFQGWMILPLVLGTQFFLLSMIGFSNPNASALAMAPFSKNAGSASALMGFLQMGVGSLSSLCVGLFNANELLPVAGIFVTSSFLALFILFWRGRKIGHRIEGEVEGTGLAH